MLIRFRGLPAGVPDSLSVFDVYMEALLIGRAVIIAVAGQPTQPRVTIEAVAACRVGQEREKILTAEIVDPWKRCARVGDHIFPLLVVKMAELHLELPPMPAGWGIPAAFEIV